MIFEIMSETTANKYAEIKYEILLIFDNFYCMCR